MKIHFAKAVLVLSVFQSVLGGEMYKECVRSKSTSGVFFGSGKSFPKDAWQAEKLDADKRGWESIFESETVTANGVTGVVQEDCTIQEEAFQLCFRPKGTQNAFKMTGLMILKADWQGNKQSFAQTNDEAAFASETATANGVTGVLQKDCSILKAETSATGYGDPHFKTWNGDQFDFHGGCELVLLQNPHFGNGLGMNIHIRTLIKGSWSYIGSGVLQIGDNTLEVAGGTGKISYWINGVEVADMETGDAALGDFPIHFHRINNHQSQTRVDLGNGNGISLETFKHFVRVNVKVKSPENFVGSAGLLGSYPMGKKVARDNKTVLEDANEFGQEWQVLASEPQLFHMAGGVQHPLKCAMPDMRMTKDTRRRLGASAITEEDAALACARVNESDRVACVFDVLATNDKEMAGSY